MSHIVIDLLIKNNTLKIKINKRINNLDNNEIIDLFCIISAFNKEEKKKGNEYDKAWIKIRYLKGVMITEYLNIFKIVRKPYLSEFVTYFTRIEEKFSTQSGDTKITLDDYFNEIEEISQEIIIIMVFNIDSDNELIQEKKQRILSILMINNMNVEIFE